MHVRLSALTRGVASYRPGDAVGLLIGNLTSQYFANHYLAILDCYVKDELKARRYLHYMDDMILWSDARDELKRARRDISEFAQDELRLTLKEPILNRSEFGATFLGMKIASGHVRLAGRSRLRFRRKYLRAISDFQLGLATERELESRLRGLFAFVCHAESRAFRLRVMQTGNETEALQPGQWGR